MVSRETMQIVAGRKRPRCQERTSTNSPAAVLELPKRKSQYEEFILCVHFGIYDATSWEDD